MKYAKVKIEGYGKEYYMSAIYIETIEDIREAVIRYGTGDSEYDIIYLSGCLPFVIPFKPEWDSRVKMRFSCLMNVIEVVESIPCGPYYVEIGDREGDGGIICSTSWRASNPTYVGREGLD